MLRCREAEGRQDGEDGFYEEVLRLFIVLLSCDAYCVIVMHYRW